MGILKRLFAGIVAAAILFATWLAYHISTAIPLPAIPYEFSIRQGSSLKAVAKQLADAKLLPEAWTFVLLGRVLGRSGEIKAGNYELSENASPLELLTRITRGDVAQSEVTIIEGWNFRQVRKVLDDHPALRHDTANLTEQEILQQIGAQETTPEGLFFPDTYYFANGGSDISVLKRAYQTMQVNLESAWATRSSDSPLGNPYEALILASIVEKETGNAGDRTMIAGVFVNRLRLGMKLQTDPTVIYGLGQSFEGNLTKRDLLSDQPYNTYTRLGLPPTPISMPGQASIQATLHPANTDALYFVARGDGTSHFSTNLADHNRAVAKYQKK